MLMFIWRYFRCALKVLWNVSTCCSFTTIQISADFNKTTNKTNIELITFEHPGLLLISVHLACLQKQIWNRCFKADRSQVGKIHFTLNYQVISCEMYQDLLDAELLLEGFSLFTANCTQCSQTFFSKLIKVFIFQTDLQFSFCQWYKK